jgi:hypothetical protein
LSTVVEEIHSSSGARVEGVRGDELLRTAFDDAVRDFRPDHILIVVGAHDFQAWHRQRVLEHLVSQVGLPVTLLPVPS